MKLWCWKSGTPFFYYEKGEQSIPVTQSSSIPRWNVSKSSSMPGYHQITWWLCLPLKDFPFNTTWLMPHNLSREKITLDKLAWVKDESGRGCGEVTMVFGACGFYAQTSTSSVQGMCSRNHVVSVNKKSLKMVWMGCVSCWVVKH